MKAWRALDLFFYSIASVAIGTDSVFSQVSTRGWNGGPGWTPVNLPQRERQMEH
jgi:hypothetical protein